MCNVWPNFFVVGAAKAGTTSLYEYLKQHPQIFMCPVKEPRFFARTTNLERYINIPPITLEQEYLELFRTAGKAKAIGEASPNYLCDREAPYRIKEKVPAVRNIILLRDPIERAYSQYLHFVRLGIETKSFYDALFGEYRENYIELGRYYNQVKRYLEIFGADQVLLLLFEALRQNPLEIVGQVADFLKVDRESVQYISVDTVYNPYMTPRNFVFRYLLSSTISVRYHFFRKIIPRQTRNYVYNRFFVKNAIKPPLDPKAVEFLKTIYEKEILDLEKLLYFPLPELRQGW